MAQTLGSVAAGTVVKLNENNSPVNYIVVHQGLPSSLYDASCSGTWLVRQSIAENRIWKSTNISTYGNSDINTYLNGTWLERYDTNIRNAIKTVKIPYCADVTDRTINSGANGLSCKVFLLSCYEVGWTKDMNSGMVEDGAKLDYFLLGTSTEAENKRIATLNDSAADWWLRSPYLINTYTVYGVYFDGQGMPKPPTQSNGVRPAIIMDGATTYVLDDGTITLSQPPTAPGSITVPPVAAGQQAAITWMAATDPDGTIASYTLERSVNGSGWTQIFSGSALTYTDTIGSDWATIAYRVCAVDNYGVSGPYTLSETQTVQDGILYISGPASSIGGKTAPFAFTVSTGVSGDTQIVNVNLEISLDGSQLYSGTVSTGQEVSVTIDTRVIGGGNHAIEASASAEDYIEANESYTFTTPSIVLPSGGLGVQLQDDQGRPMFPQSVASLIAGMDGKSIAGNLQEMLFAVSNVFTKEQTLREETAEMYGLNETAVPDDVFIILALGAGKYGYGITVKYPDGTPAAGLSVTGVTGRLGEAIITDENGYFLAVSENNKISFSIKSPYFDIANISNQAVNAAGVLTRQTVEFAYKTYEDYILLTTSQVMKFSRAYKLDLTAVGGGGGGAAGVSQASAGDFGGGGGGGYVNTVLDVQIDKDESLQLNIGSGGTVGTFSGSSAQKYYAGSGGYTQVVRNKDQSVIVTATGGNGGQGSYRENNTSLNFASGNGVGGGYTYQGAPTYAGKGASGTAGTGFIFNDQSLGLAGGGGGGSSNPNDYSSFAGGTPHGATGGYASASFTFVNAASPGVGGGGGGGFSNSNGIAKGSAGGNGGLYLRLKSETTANIVEG